MDNNALKQTITLIDGKIFTMNGVKNIAEFDESFVSLDTEGGRVNIEGDEMKIESLGAEGGNILIKGNINAFYRSKEISKKKGFFGKMLG